MWICPRGVAPERMPKAEATTGLAPKKASAHKPSGRPSGRLPEGFGWGLGFDFDVPISLVEFRRSGGLGLGNAKMAGLLLPSHPCPAVWSSSTGRIGNGHGLLQGGRRALPEAFHPLTLAARLGARARLGWLGRFLNVARGPWELTLLDP